MFREALSRTAPKCKQPECHQRIHGRRKCGVSVQWNVIHQQKGMKYLCITWWTLKRSICLWRQAPLFHLPLLIPHRILIGKNRHNLDFPVFLAKLHLNTIFHPAFRQDEQIRGCETQSRPSGNFADSGADPAPGRDSAVLSFASGVERTTRPAGAATRWWQLWLLEHRMEKSLLPAYIAHLERGRKTHFCCVLCWATKISGLSVNTPWLRPSWPCGSGMNCSMA